MLFAMMTRNPRVQGGELIRLEADENRDALSSRSRVLSLIGNRSSLPGHKA
jgi:hypothetical protein